MPRKKRPWPIWKIGLTIVLCSVAAVALFVLWTYLEAHTPAEPEPGRRRAIAAPGFVLLFAFGAALAAVCAAGWLAYRLYLARIPPWEKGAKKFDRPTRRRH